MKKTLFFILSIILSVGVLAKNANEYQRDIAAAEAAQDLQLLLQLYDEYLQDYEKAGGSQAEKPTVIYSYGVMLGYAGEYEKALRLLFPVFEKVKDDPDQKKITAQFSMQLGVISFFMNDYDKALLYYKTAESLAQEINNVEGLAIAKNNIGNIYQKQKYYQKAIDSYKECLQIEETVQDSATICNTLFNIGTCYEELGLNEQALGQFSKAQKLAFEINDKEIAALSSIHLGIINNNRAQIQKGIALVEGTGYREVLLEAYLKHAQLSADHQDYEVAYSALDKALALKDSIHNAETVKVLNEFTVKYEKNKLENEKRLQTILFIFIGIVLLLIIATLVVVLRYNVITKNKLRDINQTKDKFFSTISHELKNPLIAQKKVLEILNSNIENFSIQEVKQLNVELLNSSKSVLTLLYNLLDWSKVERKLISLKPIEIELKKVVEVVVEDMHLALKQKNIEVQLQISDDLQLYADPLILSIIIKNILDNAVKFSHENGKIDILAQGGAEKCRITIQDHGVGMSKETMDKLFKLNAMQSKNGTKGETGGGIGFIITKELVALHGGALKVSSQESKGTSVVFSINNNSTKYAKS